MKRTVTQKQYCVELTTAEMLKILRRDDNIGGDNLERRMSDLGGLSDIKYDGHFGPYIWYSMNVVYDFPHNHKLIERTIQDYIDGK